MNKFYFAFAAVAFGAFLGTTVAFAASVDVDTSTEDTTDLSSSAVADDASEDTTNLGGSAQISDPEDGEDDTTDLGNGNGSQDDGEDDTTDLGGSDNGTPDDDEDEDDDNNGSRSSRSGQRRSSGSSRGEVLGATTGSCPLITSYMRMGQANDVEQVKALQEFLNKELGISLPVTGFFGELTTKAVNDFQLKYKNDVLKPWVDAGLHESVEVPTGFVYITTAHMINSIACDDFDEELPALVPASN